MLALALTMAISAGPTEIRNEWLAVVKAAAHHYDLDWRLVDSVIYEESTWNPQALSSAGAMGLGQLMPSTAEYLGVYDPWDPGQNIWGVALYLNRLHGRFGEWPLALAGYNAGPTRVDRCQCIPFTETHVYVHKVIKRWKGQ